MVQDTWLHVPHTLGTSLHADGRGVRTWDPSIQRNAEERGGHACVAQHLCSITSPEWYSVTHRSNASQWHKMKSCQAADSVVKLSGPTQQVLRWLRLTNSGLRPRRSVMPPAAMTPVPAAFTMPTRIVPRIGDFRPASENTCTHHHTHETHDFACSACLHDKRKCVISVAQEQEGQLTLAE